MMRHDYDNEDVASAMASALYDSREDETADSVSTAVSFLLEQGGMTGELPAKHKLVAFCRALADAIESIDTNEYDYFAQD